MLEQIFRWPDSATFLQTQEKRYSYQWLKERVQKLTGLFESMRLQSGDKMLLAISEENEFAAVFISALLGGITVVMIDPATKNARAASIINRVAPKLIIADSSSLKRWSGIELNTARLLSFQKKESGTAGLLGKFLQKAKADIDANDYLANLQSAQSLMPSASPSPETIAYIIFTSGTTSTSKGVAISHANLLAHLETLKNVYSLETGSAILNQLLLWHADGCIQGPVLAAYTGCAWHRPFVFSIEKIHQLLDYPYAHDVSHWIVVPAMLNLMVGFSEGYEKSVDYPEFKALISVSAHLEPPLWDKIEQTFGVQINNVYGLTETVAGSIFCGPLKGTYKKYTIGRPVDTETKIINESREKQPAGEVGELLLKGSHVMSAYYDDESATADSFFDGWLASGDLASEDEDGFITIRGRKKNLIISGGYNIQPEEVTECLLRNENIAEACAIGMPDDVFGEKLVAAVVLKPGSVCTPTEVADHCRDWLEDRKIPQKIYIVPALPKGPSGKVLLQELRTELARTGKEQSVPDGAVVDEVLAIASESFQVPLSSLSERDTSQTIAGWDSLAHLTFVTLLEERFNTQFSTAEVMTLNSVRKAVQLIKDRHG